MYRCRRKNLRKMTDIEFLKYPIGKFQFDPNSDEHSLQKAIETIKSLPEHLMETVKHLSEPQLDTPYRPGGWTVRQVIHHVGDSHMNALIRFKLALTEDTPTIKPYDEAAWAKLSDYSFEIELSLALIRLIHAKWVAILEHMTEADFQRTYFHPESQKEQTLLEVAHMYAWHSQHHLSHIQQLMIRENWTTPTP